MKIGLIGLNFPLCYSAKTIATVARAAADEGIESLWTGEHIILPVRQGDWPPETWFVDTTTFLAFVAAHTKTVRLGTGIIILPLRNPLVLAKELASLDYLPEGRLIFGIGAGYLKPEFDALGIPFTERGARTEEYVKAIRALWTMERPEFSGKFVSFRGVQAIPRPAQKPHPPIVFGGASPAAFSRVARLGDGWFGFGLDLDMTKDCMDGIRKTCETAGRRFEDLEISVTPGGPIDGDTAKRFADIGVHRLVAYPLVAYYRFMLTHDEAGLLEAVKDLGQLVRRLLIGD
jgi:probable F420-dependent oxidoreductase